MCLSIALCVRDISLCLFCLNLAFVTYNIGHCNWYSCIHTSKHANKLACMHTYTCRCVHTYIHAYISTWIIMINHKYTDTDFWTCVQQRTYIRTYVHMYIQTYWHTDIHAHMRTCMQHIPAYMLTFTHTYRNTCVYTGTRAYMHRYGHTCTQWHINPCIHMYLLCTYIHACRRAGRHACMYAYIQMY